MAKKNLALMVLMLCWLSLAGQGFVFEPEKPKPGDEIRVSYSPAGDIANTLGKVEAVVFVSGSAGRKADDLLLTRAGKKYTATIQTDTAHTFIQLGFYVDDKFDNNFGQGYYIHLHNGNQPRKGSCYELALLYQYYGSDTRVEKDNARAIAAFEQEFKLYPAQKKKLAGNYFRLMLNENRDEGMTMIEKEIEELLGQGLATEDDYVFLETLYNLSKQGDKAKSASAEKKQKFPEGKWVINETIDQYLKETDPVAKAEKLNAITANIAQKEAWKPFARSLDYFRSSLLGLYAKTKDWQSYRTFAESLSNRISVASGYNSVAWGLQERKEDLAVAAELASAATEISRNEMTKPIMPRPDHLTAKKWEKQRQATYAAHADTYAMVLYRLEDHRKGFDLAKEAALTISEGKDADQNNTYALLAEKVLPAHELTGQLEKFVRDGQATSAIKEMLKRNYIAAKGSDDGFGEYIGALEKESYLRMVEELRKSMLNETSPSFSLADLDGKKISTAELRGKIVIIDFWATWCGPCKASFPGMQKIVDKYSESPDVKFVFIDTWERVENKEKNAADFIGENRYTFHVLMDNDNKVVEQFKVEGIPTKFVLDKEGKIRFKSVGFSGSEDKLIAELSAMIDIARTEKTF